jgi:hypothetical protein
MNNLIYGIMVGKGLGNGFGNSLGNDLGNSLGSGLGGSLGGGLGRSIASFLSALMAMNILFFVLGAALVIGTYFFVGYSIMCTGRKAGLEDDWMPYVPICRQLYQMKITDSPWWYVFFFGATFISIAPISLLLLLFFLLTQNFALVVVLFVAYFAANIVFTLFYYFRFYAKFGFNKFAAWFHVITALNLIGTVFGFYIAFANCVTCGNGRSTGNVSGDQGMIPPDSYQKPHASIRGLSGQYLNAVFDISDGNEVILGRNPMQANLVFDGSQEHISNKHCSIRYNRENDCYIVTDFSSIGTFTGNGVRLTREQPMSLPHGTEIYLVDKTNAFKLD